MKKKEIRNRIVRALAEKMPEGKKKKCEVKSEAIPFSDVEQME